jgi:hypothetical protein
VFEVPKGISDHISGVRHMQSVSKSKITDNQERKKKIADENKELLQRGYGVVLTRWAFCKAAHGLTR